MKNVILIVADCLRTDFAYDPQIMPFLNNFKDRYNYSENAHTNASSTHFAMPTLMTGFMPFETTDESKINASNIENYLPKIFKNRGYKTIGITTNAVTSRVFGYNKYWDFFEDYYSSWEKLNKLNELKKKIFGIFPEKLKTEIIDRILRTINDYINTPEKTKKSWRGERILHTLKSLKIGKKEGNFIFLHFMEPHSPYISYKAGLSIKKANKLNRKLSRTRGTDKKHRLNEIEVSELKKLYRYECKHMDKILEKTLKYLKKRLNWDNTKIMILADHGEAFNETGYMEHPYRLINNPHHANIPLITKGIEFASSKEHWLVDCYDMISPGKNLKRKNHRIAISYDKKKNGSISKYKPTGYYNLDRFIRINSKKDLPYKSRKDIISTISV